MARADGKPQGKGRGTPKGSPRAIEAAEKRAQGLRMLKNGANWDTIAAECGWANRGTAWTEVMKELRDIPAQEAADLRVLLHQRYESVYQLMYTVALKDRDPRAAQAAMEALASERRMFGLDAPAQARIEVFDDGAAEARIDRLSREVMDLAEQAGEGDGVPREAPADS